MTRSLMFNSCRECLVNPRETLCYDPKTQITHPTVLHMTDDRGRSSDGAGSFIVTCYDTLVVEVTAIANRDAACSMAISFGPGSRFNKRAVKDGCDWRLGICYVVFEALNLAKVVLRESSHRLGRVVVMLDSDWLMGELHCGTSGHPLRTVLIHQINRMIADASQRGFEVGLFSCPAIRRERQNNERFRADLFFQIKFW